MYSLCACFTNFLTPKQSIPMQDQSAKDKALQSMASMSSAQIVSASAIHNKAIQQGLALPHSVGITRPTYPGGGSQVRCYLIAIFIFFCCKFLVI